MRQLTSLFFVLLFGSFMAIPTFVAFFDNAADISYIHISTEEEKTNSERLIDEIENKQNDKMFFFDPYIWGYNKEVNLETPTPFWGSLYFRINLPPPELS